MTIIAQKKFIEDALKQGIRLDARKAFDIRKVRISLPTSGQSQVQCGKTRVLAQVSCSIVRPRQGSPQEGIIQVNTVLSPMADSKFDQQRFCDEELHVSRLLERCLMKSRAVDTEGLCIVAGEQVYNLFLSIIIQL